MFRNPSFQLPDHSLAGYEAVTIRRDGPPTTRPVSSRDDIRRRSDLVVKTGDRRLDVSDRLEHDFDRTAERSPLGSRSPQRDYEIHPCVLARVGSRIRGAAAGVPTEKPSV